MEMEDCDVVGISETWLTQNVLNQSLSIGNHKIVRNDRKARGGGITFCLFLLLRVNQRRIIILCFY
jgi:hypothetical protein